MLTSQEIYEEYVKCITDPAYVIESYLKTSDLTRGGYVPFKLFPRQKDIVAAYEKYDNNIITKPRQAGVSTTTAAYLAVKAAFADLKKPECILIIANKQDLAINFLSKVKEFLMQLPRWIWGAEYYGNPKNEEKEIFVKNSEKEIILPNGSRIKAVATSKTAARGFTPTYLVMDEAAYIENGEETYTAAQASLSSGGKCFLLSTPNSLDELYYKTYQQAKDKKNDFNIIEMKWYEDLRYNKDLKWVKVIDENNTETIVEYEFTFASYEQKIKDGFKPTSSWYEMMCRKFNNNARKIAQELDVSFIGSGGNVIEEQYIQQQEKQNVREPKYTRGAENEIWVWEDPIVGHQYCLTSDVSRGDGKDSSTIVIIDFTTMEQVMEYQGKVQPDLLAYIIKEWGDKYNAYIVVDITGGMGVPTELKLLELGCTRLHYDHAHNPTLMAYANAENKTPGFTINSVRTPMISHLEYSVRENVIKIRSQRLTSEMKTFIFKDNGKADHMTGYHDDLLMALAMGLWVLEHSFKNLERVNEQTKAMLNAFIGYDPLKGKPTDQPKVANPFLKQTKQNRIGGSNILWIPPR